MQRALEDHPVVVLSGPRQVGKSTFLRHALPVRRWPYRTLDDFDVLEQAERDPEALWSGTDRVVLDEVQRAPRLLSAIKRAVDRRERQFRAVLSGSANLLLMQQVSETLAGRAVYFLLWPMTLGEAGGRPVSPLLGKLFRGELPPEGAVAAPRVDPMDLVARGLMPPLLRLSGTEAITSWWEGYVGTYLERDLRQISRVASLADFRRVMQSIALRSGQLVNQTDAARDAGVSQASVYRYLNLLEASCVVDRVPAFARSRTKRLIKSPKLYLVDAGLAAYLGGYHGPDAVRGARECGGFMEPLILQHLRVLSQLLVPKPAIFDWRTTSGREVDFVLEQGRRLVAVEVKLTSRPHYADAEGLRLFLEEYPEGSCGVLVHTGTAVRRLGERIVALPWTMLAAGVGGATHVVTGARHAARDR